jgi:hypothetical protein
LFALKNNWATDKVWLEGEAVEQAVVGSATITSAFAYQVVGGALPKGITLDTATGALRGTIALDAVTLSGDVNKTQNFSFTVQFNVLASGETLQQTFNMQVKNKPASWASQNLTPPTIKANKRVNIPNISLGNFNKAPDGNLVGIKVLSPEWLIYNTSTNSFTGVPPTIGTFEYSLEIDDGVNGKLVRNGVLNVAATYEGPDNRAPTVISPNSMFSQYRQAIENNIWEPQWDKYGNLIPQPSTVPAVQIFIDPLSIFTDDNGDVLSLTIDNLPAGLTLEKLSDTSYMLTQIDPQGTVADFDQLLNFKVSDGRGGVAQAQLRVQVLTTNNGGGGAMAMGASPEVDFQSLMLSEDGTTDFSNVQSMMFAPEPEEEIPEPATPPVGSDQLLKTYWFAYDASNRVIVDGGLYNAGGLITISQGSKIFYNTAGQQEYVINPSEGKASKYVYNSLGQVELVYQSGNVTKEQLSSAISGSSIEFDWRLLSKMTYDGQGRVKEQLTYATKEPAEIIIRPRELSSELTLQQRDILASKKVKLDIRGALIGQVINTYNADGEMQQIQQFGRTEENLFLNATLEFNASHPLDYYLSLDVGEIINVAHFYSNPSDLRYVSQTRNSNLNEGGMATTTQITEFGEKPGAADISRTFTRSYQLRDNWLETKVIGTGDATKGTVSAGSTSSIYDSNGNRKEINEINDNTPDETITRRMLFSADGSLIKKMEGKKGKPTIADFLSGNGGFTQEAYSYHFTSNGNYLGEVAEGKKSSNSDSQFGKITSTLKNQHFSAPDLTSGTPASNYQVRSGDTLKNIALMFYGNADYWYLIANTNGLTSDPTAPLVAGMALVLLAVSQALLQGKVLVKS